MSDTTSYARNVVVKVRNMPPTINHHSRSPDSITTKRIPRSNRPQCLLSPRPPAPPISPGQELDPQAERQVEHDRAQSDAQEQKEYYLVAAWWVLIGSVAARA